jgi:hypothetical protein
MGETDGKKSEGTRKFEVAGDGLVETPVTPPAKPVLGPATARVVGEQSTYPLDKNGKDTRQPGC